MPDCRTTPYTKSEIVYDLIYRVGQLDQWIGEPMGRRGDEQRWASGAGGRNGSQRSPRSVNELGLVGLQHPDFAPAVEEERHGSDPEQEDQQDQTDLFGADVEAAGRGHFAVVDRRVGGRREGVRVVLQGRRWSSRRLDDHAGVVVVVLAQHGEDGDDGRSRIGRWVEPFGVQSVAVGSRAVHHWRRRRRIVQRKKQRILHVELCFCVFRIQ